MRRSLFTGFALAEEDYHLGAGRLVLHQPGLYQALTGVDWSGSDLADTLGGGYSPVCES